MMTQFGNEAVPSTSPVAWWTSIETGEWPWHGYNSVFGDHACRDAGFGTQSCDPSFTVDHGSVFFSRNTVPIYGMETKNQKREKANRQLLMFSHSLTLFFHAETFGFLFFVSHYCDYSFLLSTLEHGCSPFIMSKVPTNFLKGEG